MQSKACFFCRKVFFKTSNLSQKAWETTRKFCSCSCRAKGLPSPKKGKKYPHLSGKNHPSWKGDEVGYMGLHSWISRHKGKALVCENVNCQTENPKKFEWSNISGEYKRDVNDFESLCSWCHRKKDLSGKIPWNKGKKGLQVAWNKGITGKNSHSFGNTHGFKKGHVSWNKGIPNSGFKKGYIPWNKKVI